MKLHFLFLSLILVLLSGCSAKLQNNLPELSGAENVESRHACAAVFPDGRWQFVHSIDFTMNNGGGTTVIGVTTLAENGIECALITVEGFTLFEAVYGEAQSFKVDRAVPPFDDPEFAKGLIRDIRAIFQPPVGSMVKTGQVADGASVCRYENKDGRLTDVLPDVDDCWQINSYSSGLIMDRSVIGRSCRKKGNGYIPDHLHLKTFGQTGYSLKMTLISADNFK